ncbi:MAG: sulfatase [Verrucomicrobia bacterium]|nr:sulfatase [Verrucomicrobiota bacterium]
MKSYLTLCLFILTISFVSTALAADKPSVVSNSNPNLVFIIADDCTFREIGCYGGQALTPNIDQLATEGMRFERCFQAAPMCSPTRHNIYTGLYPVKSGAYPNHTNAYGYLKSVVHYLEPLGYRVAQSGKMHIGPTEVFPFEYLQAIGNNPNMELINTLFAEVSESKQPFCLFACSNEPHTPWNKGDPSVYPPEKVQLPPYIVDTPKVRDDFSRYLAEISYFDGQVGEILAMLDKHGLSENTLVMVVSEQGNAFPFAKWTCYDHGLQSAMIVRWPGMVKPNTVTDAMVEYVDVTPTFIEAAGGSPIKDLDGRSFVPILKGQTNHHKDYVYSLMTTRGIINGSEAFAIRSIRSSHYKLILNLNHETKFTNACTRSDYFQSMVEKAESGDATAKTLVNAYYYRPAVELFDLQADPLQMNNLAGDSTFGKVIKHLKGKLHAWMDEQGDRGIATEMKAYDRMPKKSEPSKRKSQ